jgi:hypothetical protein
MFELRLTRRGSILASEDAMLTAVRQRTVVQPGGVIQISAPDLPVGTVAEVLVIVEGTEGPQTALADMVGAGHGGFSSPDEADRFLRAERDSWRS